MPALLFHMISKDFNYSKQDMMDTANGNRTTTVINRTYLYCVLVFGHFFRQGTTNAIIKLMEIKAQNRIKFKTTSALQKNVVCIA